MDGGTPKTSRDPFFVVILVGVCCVSLWLLLMPWCPGIARQSMKRFHLASDSFPLWAAQAPIPAMYNFGNRYEVRDLPEGLMTPVFDSSEPRYINHFPLRVLTFANKRYVLLSPGQDRWLTVWSEYRGQMLETKVHVKPIGAGRFEMVRESSQFLSRDGVQE